MQNQKRVHLAESGLFLVTILWGTSFVIIKQATALVEPGYLLGIRFLFAAVMMALIFHKRLKLLTLDSLKFSFILGGLLFLSYYLQTVAIKYTTAGKNAFLTTIYVIIVPFLYWIIRKVRPRPVNLISAFFCIIGIALISLSGDSFSLNFGDFLTILCGFFFASHIVFLSIASRQYDPILMSILQFFIVGILSFLVAVFTEPVPVLSPASLLPILYLAVFCTMIALGLQAVGEKYVNPSKASLIMSLESLIGCISGIVFLGEPLTIKLVAGFAMIFLAMLISELPTILSKTGPASKSEP
ncbi:MAG: DMT family transporter [Oscillospiraceae bacterium]|jgi:drug/metabolite transporter (DMT)-like permease|nr:Permease of the drug/metabolite transporter (DMT) superfamily [Ruminococcaceae bacterium BL-4]